MHYRRWRTGPPRAVCYHSREPCPASGEDKLATQKELSDFLASVERRAFKQCVYAVQEEQAARVAALKQSRDGARVAKALGDLKDAARGSGGLMEPILEASRAYATLGEMCDALREVWGEYEEPPVF